MIHEHLTAILTYLLYTMMNYNRKMAFNLGPSYKFLFMYSAIGHNRHRYHSMYAEGYPYLQERLKYTSIQMQSVGSGSQTISFTKKENIGLHK